MCRARLICNILHNIAGIGGYVIPSDVRSLLDQLKDLAESLGLPKEEGAEEAATQPGEEKLQKKLPPQLNPLLAKLARAAARENEKSPGKPTFRFTITLLTKAICAQQWLQSIITQAAGYFQHGQAHNDGCSHSNCSALAITAYSFLPSWTEAQLCGIQDSSMFLVESVQRRCTIYAASRCQHSGQHGNLPCELIYRKQHIRMAVHRRCSHYNCQRSLQLSAPLDSEGQHGCAPQEAA